MQKRQVPLIGPTQVTSTALLLKGAGHKIQFWAFRVLQLSKSHWKDRMNAECQMTIISLKWMRAPSSRPSQGSPALHFQVEGSGLCTSLRTAHAHWELTCPRSLPPFNHHQHNSKWLAGSSGDAETWPPAPTRHLWRPFHSRTPCGIDQGHCS